MTLRRSVILSSALTILGCSQAWSPPAQPPPVPRPTIYVRTGEGWVPMTPEQAAAYDSPATSRPAQATSEVVPDHSHGTFTDSDSALPLIGILDCPSPPIKPTASMKPVYPQAYYLRPEQTSTGYSPGEYGRMDNFTPGRHTSTGYCYGHYRADGALSYTRPEHTASRYLPGHYRAESLPTLYSPPPLTIHPISSPHPGLR